MLQTQLIIEDKEFLEESALMIVLALAALSSLGVKAEDNRSGVLWGKW